MSIVLICNHKDPQPWAAGLREAFPGTAIEIFPAVQDREAIRFAICWKPEAGVLALFPNLEVVQSLGAGVEHILQTNPLSPSQRLSRIVDPGLANDMWEFLLAAVMSYLKRLRPYWRQQQDKTWRQHNYQTIAQTSIGILGLGEIGALVAQRFAQLGFQVEGWAASPKAIPDVNSYVGNDGLAACLAEADVLINILPLTPHTEGLLNRTLLLHLPRGAYLINVGRGAHLVDRDLLGLLDENHLAGALLDVFQQEPLPQDHPFWTHPRVTLTPHIASLTNVDTAMAQIIENYQRWLNGKTLLHQVQLTKGY